MDVFFIFCFDLEQFRVGRLYIDIIKWYKKEKKAKLYNNAFVDSYRKQPTALFTLISFIDDFKNPYTNTFEIHPIYQVQIFFSFNSVV